MSVSPNNNQESLQRELKTKEKGAQKLMIILRCFLSSKEDVSVQKIFNVLKMAAFI